MTVDSRNTEDGTRYSEKEGMREITLSTKITESESDGHGK